MDTSFRPRTGVVLGVIATGLFLLYQFWVWEINLLTAEFNARIATLDAERTVVLAEAESTANRLKEIAKSAL